MTVEGPAPDAQDGLEAFAALAAHQLGEAIALMRGAGAVLQLQQSELGTSGQDALRALRLGGDRAQRYVDDLLDVARAGADPEEPAGTDLDPALDSALAELDEHLRRVPVHVQREPLPRAALDEHEAQRLFVHLLRSALSAGATRLGITGAAEGDTVTIEVYDNGTPPQAGDQLFEAFTPPRGRGPLLGAGLSLPICRRLCVRRGGCIGLEVRADGATIIKVDLPSAP
jgi:signal transduction histidine kinase